MRRDKTGLKYRHLKQGVEDRISGGDGEVFSNPRRKGYSCKPPKCDACGKYQYPDRASAEGAIQVLSKINSDRVFTPYSCPHSDKWHLTTTRPGHRKDGTKIRKRKKS